MQFLFFPSGLKALPKVLFVAVMVLISVLCLMRNSVIQGGIMDLGYPAYLITLLGLGYGAGMIGIVQGVSSFIREWAYAGLSIAFGGAVASHVFSGSPVTYVVPSAGLLMLCLVVYRLDSTSAQGVG